MTLKAAALIETEETEQEIATTSLEELQERFWVEDSDLKLMYDGHGGIILFSLTHKWSKEKEAAQPIGIVADNEQGDGEYVITTLGKALLAMRMETIERIMPQVRDEVIAAIWAEETSREIVAATAEYIFHLNR